MGFLSGLLGGGSGGGIDQSKNAESTSSTTSTQDSSQGSHNTDNSYNLDGGSQVSQSVTTNDSKYDNHSRVSAGDNSTITITDGGAVKGAFDLIDDVFSKIGSALGGKSMGQESGYAAQPPSAGVPTWVYVAVAGVGVLALGGIIYAATRK